jgi:fumarylpyruvate hydrolase
MGYLFDPGPTPSLPIAGRSERFPVRHIFCVGRNYEAHAREMGKDPQRDPPFFFTKPADALVPGGGPTEYPPMTDNYHHEIELVVAIGSPGRDIAAEHALDHVYGYAVGLDMTRRDLQLAARDQGRPWDFGKAFEQSAPIGAIHAAAEHGHRSRGAIWLKVNGELRQRADLGDLIWSVPEQIAYLSRYYTLRAGDLIMTGTPAGVAPVVPGDELLGYIEGLGELAVTIRPRASQGEAR